MSSESPSNTSSGSPRLLSSSSPTSISNPPTTIASDPLAKASSTPLSAALPSTSAAVSPIVSPDAISGGVKQLKRNQKDNLAEDLEVTNEPKLTDENLNPRLKIAKASKRKRVENVGVEMAKKPNFDHKASKENGLATDLRATEKSEPTVEELQRALEATKNDLRMLNIELSMANHKLQNAEVQYLPWADDLINQFGSLSFSISQFVLNDLVEEFEGSTLPEKVEKKLMEVSERPAHKFLVPDGLASFLFQGLIWHVLCSEIFDNPFKLWGEDDEIGQVVAGIMSGEPGDNRERLHAWRTLTSQILCDRPMNDKKIQGIKEELLQLVEPFITKDNKEAEPKTELRFDRIFELALKVARDIYRYKTRFEIMRKGSSDARNISQAFDDSWMCITGENVGDLDVVDLLVIPALVGRYTDWSGQEKAAVYHKAEVCYRNGPDFYDSDEYRQIQSLNKKSEFRNCERELEEDFDDIW
ncbi:hypothetical protein F4776DRAFT_652188 [Hypoxylon sp. NC0597]|nr:hypothetical protein F4776DRAFT_652188 [Hypoxylon sp. NC0597]